MNEIELANITELLILGSSRALVIIVHASEVTAAYMAMWSSK